jgi:hypothetical protein
LRLHGGSSNKRLLVDRTEDIGLLCREELVVGLADDLLLAQVKRSNSFS